MSLFHTSFVKGIWLIEESKYLGGQLLNFSKRVYVIRHDYKTSYLKSCAFFGQQNFSAWCFPQPETSWSQEDSCPCTVPDLSHFLHLLLLVLGYTCKSLLHQLPGLAQLHSLLPHAVEWDWLVPWSRDVVVSWEALNAARRSWIFLSWSFHELIDKFLFCGCHGGRVLVVWISIYRRV